MKRFLATIVIAAWTAIPAGAVLFDIGGLYGLRTVSDSDIKSTYGSGLVYYPFVHFVYKGLLVGGGYEGGYKKEGRIGLFDEKTTLQVQGFEVFVGYQVALGPVTPYIKAGYASFSYKQTIDNPALSGFKVDHKASTFTVGGGLKVRPIPNLFIIAEGRFVPLKVKPYDDEVDLGGFRLQGGFGISF